MWANAQRDGRPAEHRWRPLTPCFRGLWVAVAIGDPRYSDPSLWRTGTMFGHLLGWYTLYMHFRGLLPPDGILPAQNSLHAQVLRSPILAALLYGTRAVGVSKTLGREIFTRQGGHPVRHWSVELSSLLYVSSRHVLVMAALRYRAGHYIFALWFLSIYLLLRFFLA